MKNIILLIIFIASTTQCFSQEQSFHENGKIYAVIAVVMVILLGIFFFLIRQDRKLTKLEKEINKQ